MAVRSNMSEPLAHQESDSILLIDDKQIMLECFSAWLSSNSPNDTVHPCSSVSDAILQAGSGIGKVSVILLNINDKSVFDAEVTEGLSSLNKALPNVPVIVISNREEPEYIVEALEHGTRGYIPASTNMKVVIGAIRLVKTGGTFVPVSALMSAAQYGKAKLTISSLPTDTNLQEFTPRQMQVLACLRQGKANKTIAYELNMCESTVKVHVRHIMKKLNATNRTQVAFLTNNLFCEPPNSLSINAA